MDNEGQHFPNRLREHRIANGLKQIHVARLLGYSCAAPISRWEKGQSVPGFFNLIKLCIIYHAHPEDLFFDYFKEQEHILANSTQKIIFES